MIHGSAKPWTEWQAGHCVSVSGWTELARKIAPAINADIHGPRCCADAPFHFGKATPHIGDLQQWPSHCWRLCGRYLRCCTVPEAQEHDTPVLAAESGGFVVPLIGGHHGAITWHER